MKRLPLSSSTRYFREILDRRASSWARALAILTGVALLTGMQVSGAIPATRSMANVPQSRSESERAPDRVHIPSLTRRMTLDGDCTASKYKGAAHVRLQPKGILYMDVLLASDALYMCTNILFGRPGPNNSVTIYIDRSDRGGETPNPFALRIRLTPDDNLVVASGNGRGFSAISHGGIVSRTVTSPRFAIQEDEDPVNTGWWEGELRIPLGMLAPFKPGEGLRLAILYLGTVKAHATKYVKRALTIREQWPAGFKARRPGTWGVASTEPLKRSAARASKRAATPSQTDRVRRDAPRSSPKSAALLQAPVGLTRRGERGPSSSWPRPPPTTSAYYAHCPTGLLYQPPYAYNPKAKWPYVDAGRHLVQAEGELASIWRSPEDSPLIHRSHDLDMHVNVIPDNRWVVLNGGSDLVVETESGAFPLVARPSPRDHVTVQGRWIFDCGHAPKTEIHPTPYFESDRDEVRPVGASRLLQTVRIARVWINSKPSVFSYRLVAPFSFNVRFPGSSAGRRNPFVVVLQGDAARVRWTTSGAGVPDTAHVSVTPPAVSGSWYFELAIGYADGVQDASARTSHYYTVHLDAIQVVNDHGHRPFHYPDWYMDMVVGGHWLQIFHHARVKDSLKVPGYRLNRPVNLIDNHLTFQATGYDNLDPRAGHVIAEGIWHMGPLEYLPGRQWLLCRTSGLDHVANGRAYYRDPTCANYRKVFKGSWVLFYHVTRTG